MKKTIITLTLCLLAGFTSRAVPGEHMMSETQDTLIIKSGDSTRVILDNLDELQELVEDFFSLFDDISSKTDREFLKSKPLTSKHKKPQFKRLTISSLMMDVGYNGIIDNTNYQSAETNAFLNVDPAKRNRNFMGIKTWSSRNFNIWPLLVNINTVQSKHQNLFISSGVGFQFYNYKFSNAVDIQGGVNPQIAESNLHLTKNKLGVTYLSVPLLLTGQTKVSNHYWLTYGVGVIGGYRICSWTNQKSSELGKVKKRDNFNLNDFQYSVTGELGLKNILRLYATYQLTDMWQDGLHQQPFAIGVRFFGI